jgi:hypothetical protein
MTRCWPADLPFEYNKVSHVHLHPFADEGDFKLMQDGQFFPTQIWGFHGYPGPSDKDLSNEQNKTGYRKIAVDKKNIYLFNSSNSQTITIPRP